MRLCRFDKDRLGLVVGDRVFDVTAAQDEIRAATPYDMFGDAVIAALPAWRGRLTGMIETARSYAVADVSLLAPVLRPSKIMAAPTNYRAHVTEMEVLAAKTGKSKAQPIDTAGIFLKSNSSLVGPSQGIPLRFPDRRNDYEVEIVVVIGKKGSDIPKERALDYVAGYCLGLDMTLRGTEERSFRKSPDGYSVLGPWMVSADAIEDPDNLPLSLSVNGQIRQQSNTEDLIFEIARLIEFASTFYTLHPGDLYFTGTPEGVGPVQAGDVMRAECLQIGVMEVEVRAHRSA